MFYHGNKARYQFFLDFDNADSLYIIIRVNINTYMASQAIVFDYN